MILSKDDVEVKGYSEIPSLTAYVEDMPRYTMIFRTNVGFVDYSRRFDCTR